MAKTNKHDRVEAKQIQAQVRKNMPRTLKVFGGGDMTKQELTKKYPATKSVGKMARLKNENKNRR